jgi:hypothetical protein
MPTAISVVPPFPFFPDTDGQPLEDGFVYVGTSGLNPLIDANLVSVFSDPSLTIPVAQPIRTLGGYPVSNGSPMRIYTSGSDYSILVSDRNNALVYASLTNPPKFGGLSSTSITYVATTAENTALIVPTDLTIPSHDVTGLYDIKRYGAVNGADNTVAIAAACAVALAAGGGTIILTVNSLISAPVVNSAPNTLIDGLGHSCQFATNYVKDLGHDWSPYNQMFVLDADNVFCKRIRCLGNTVGATTNYFSGSFMWWAQTRVGGGASKNFFQNLRYDGVGNSVAIQVRNTSFNINLHHNDFVDCAGSISHQGTHAAVHHNNCKVTDAAILLPLSAVADTFDQPIGIDGSIGLSVHDNKCYASSGAPFHPSIIGANSGTANFNIYSNEIYGIRAGVALYIRSSSSGKVANNIIDGLGYTSLGNWAFLRVDELSGGVDVTNNTLRGPLVAGVGTGLGLDISTGGNTCSGNEVRFGGSTTATSLLNIRKATSPSESVFEDNYYSGGAVAVVLGFADNQLAGVEVPIIHRNNTFASPIITPYSCSGVSRQVKFYIENDKILTTAHAPTGNVLPPRIQQMFRAGLASNFDFSVGKNLHIHGVEVPSGANYYLATYQTGDEIIHAQTVAGGTEGWKCTTGGTIPDGTPYSQAGTSTNTSPIITGLANTTLMLVGDWVSPSAGFATTGPYEVIAKTATTLTLDTNANANAAPTVTHYAPVFKAKANVAA